MIGELEKTYSLYRKEHEVPKSLEAIRHKRDTTPGGVKKQKAKKTLSKAKTEKTEFEIFKDEVKSKGKNVQNVERIAKELINEHSEIKLKLDEQREGIDQLTKTVSKLVASESLATVHDLEYFLQTNKEDLTKYIDATNSRAKDIQALEENINKQRWIRTFICSKAVSKKKGFEKLSKIEFKTNISPDYAKQEFQSKPEEEVLAKSDYDLKKLQKEYSNLKAKLAKLEGKANMTEVENLHQTTNSIAQCLGQKKKSINKLNAIIDKIDINAREKVEYDKKVLEEDIRNLNTLEALTTAQLENLGSAAKNPKIKSLETKIHQNLSKQLFTKLKVSEYDIGSVRKFLNLKITRLRNIDSKGLDNAIHKDLSVKSNEGTQQKITKFQWLENLFNDEYLPVTDDYDESVFYALAKFNSIYEEDRMELFTLGRFNEFRTHIALSSMVEDGLIKNFQASEKPYDIYDRNGVDFLIELNDGSFFGLQIKSSSKWIQDHKDKYSSNVIIASGKSIGKLKQVIMGEINKPDNVTIPHNEFARDGITKYEQEDILEQYFNLGIAA